MPDTSKDAEFSANAAHQLRTPLAALRLRIEDLTLWPQVGADAEILAELHAALAETDRLAETIDDLLTLARSGTIGNSATVDLAVLSESAAWRWQRGFEDRGRTIVVDAQSTEVPSSRGAVLQILDVLLENALVHGTGGAEVTAGVGPSGPFIRVADEGSVDDAHADKIFERSYRSPTSLGSGIGLAICQTLAGAIGARLRLAAQQPTTFELTFRRPG
jgi:signal transduction histidine kinase